MTRRKKQTPSGVPVPYEKDIQKAIVDYISYACPSVLVFAVPNGAIRSAGGRAGNAVPGLRPGVADLCMIGPGQRVWFIEVKRPGGKISQAQKEFWTSCRARDVPYDVVYSLDEAIDTLSNWGLILSDNRRRNDR